MTRILLVRHGETDWNADGRVQGHLDVALNASGRDQAVRVARFLSDEPLAAVYSSDLRRASETALTVAAPHDLEVRFNDGLRERHLGAWQGLTIAEVEKRFPEQYACHRDGREFAPDGGETFQGFQDRVCAAVDLIAGAHPDQTIAVVTHGGPVKVFCLRLLNAPFSAHTLMRTGNTGVTTVHLRGGRYVLDSYNVTRHLRESPEPPGREAQVAAETAL